MINKDTKIFVGNVPFQCSRNEFQECFKHFDGYVTADIITRYRSKISRGFGFVVFKTREQANNLLAHKDIRLKDRVLRFSQYNFSGKTRDRDEEREYKVMVTGLDSGTNEDDLYDYMNIFGEILSCCVDFDDNKLVGTVVFKDAKSYYNALNSQETTLIIKPATPNTNKYQTDPKLAYQEGFLAGHLTGFQEGFKQGLEQKEKS